MFAASRDRIWQGTLAFWERRLPALTRLKASEPLPITLHRRRIYVLPSGFGLFVGCLLLAMLVGGLNYNNNPALLLTFVLASAAHTSLLQGFLDMRGVSLTDVSAEPVHAGQPARLRLRFERPEQRPRRGLIVGRGSARAQLDLDDTSAEVALAIPTTHRGLFGVGRVLVETRQPLGMFRIWSWMHPSRKLLVYPAPEPDGPPLPSAETHRGSRLQRGLGEHLHSLRSYRTGDPLRLVAWKRSAQTGQLLVREFERPTGGDAMLDWNTLAGLTTEQRISRLTCWVLDAERAGLRSILLVPGERIGPDRGGQHVHACLRCLALLPAEG